MNNRIEEFLSKVKVKPESNKSEEKASNISITNCNFGNKNNSSLIIVPFICITLLGLAFIYTMNKESELVKNINQNQNINTNLNTNELKNLIYRVSVCESKHPNTVHNELKSVFGYHYYKKINNETALKVKNILIDRLCD